jgi:hypothetical protein
VVHVTVQLADGAARGDEWRPPLNPGIYISKRSHRDHEKFENRYKKLRNGGILLLLMAISSGYGILKIGQVGEELDTIANEDIP